MAEFAVIPKTEWPSPASSAGLQEGLVKYTSGGGDEMSSPAPSSHHPGTVTDPCSLQSLPPLPYLGQIQQEQESQ